APHRCHTAVALAGERRRQVACDVGGVKVGQTRVGVEQRAALGTLFGRDRAGGRSGSALARALALPGYLIRLLWRAVKARHTIAERAAVASFAEGTRATAGELAAVVVFPGKTGRRRREVGEGACRARPCERAAGIRCRRDRLVRRG